MPLAVATAPFGIFDFIVGVADARSDFDDPFTVSVRRAWFVFE